MVTLTPVVDMVTHIPGLDTVTPMLIRLITVMDTVMAILMLPTHVAVTAIPTPVIPTLLFIGVL